MDNLLNNKKHGKALPAHAAMFLACAIWGLMSPLAKDAMRNGIDGVSLVSFRVFGGMVLFWLTSWIAVLKNNHGEKTSESAPRENKPSRHDTILLCAASIFGLVLNQCCFTIGLSFTSPSNASIITTSMPVFAMILSFLILKEPVTVKKVGGVVVGCAGALLLILSSAAANSVLVGNIRGDLMCLGAQLSYALYLTLFNRIIKKYSAVTVNKWMFLTATLLMCPFTFRHVASLPWHTIALSTWLEVIYVVVFGTYTGYILVVWAQRILRPTVVSVYNYVQPVVAVAVGFAMGLSTFTTMQGIAVILVFVGVSLVTKSKSKRDIENDKKIS